MPIRGHGHAKLFARDLLVIKTQLVGETGKLGLVGRLAQHKEDEEGEETKRKGEADNATHERDPLEEHDEKCRAEGNKAQMLPFRNGRWHGPDVGPNSHPFKQQNDSQVKR